MGVDRADQEAIITEENTDRDCLLYYLRYTIERYRELLQEANLQFTIHLIPPRRADESI